MEASFTSNKSIWSGDDQLGDHFWNFLTKPESNAIYNEDQADVEAGIVVAHTHRNDFEEIEVKDYFEYGIYNESDDKTVDEEIDEVEDVTIMRYHKDLQGLTTDYSNDEFIEATKNGDWSAMKAFIGPDYPDSLTITKFRGGGTALHHTLYFGKQREDIAKCLVERMRAQDLEIRDNNGFTALACATIHHHPNYMLECMITKNPKLLTIGQIDKIPIIIASWKGFTDTTRFLYNVTDDFLNPYDEESKVDPEKGKILGMMLLNQCISIKLFDIAKDIVERFPEFLNSRDIGRHRKSPIEALVKTMCALQVSLAERKQSGGGKSSNDRIHMREADEFLRFIVSMGDVKELCNIHEAMVEAAKKGNIEFINTMLEADRELVHLGSRSIFWEAVKSREAKVFSLIYDYEEDKDSLLSFINNRNVEPKKKEDESRVEDKTNILHCAAELPPPLVLDRISGGPAYLQMQTEVQWFQAVRDIVNPRYRDDTNNSGSTPKELFTITHKDLVEAGEKSLKKTAASATTVAALIVTTMFAASFAVITGNNQIKGSHQSSLSKALFVAFIACDALSLFSSATSILVFLGTLAARYSQEDFLVALPRKFIDGFYALFCSITTMMLAFCCALFIMLQGWFDFVVIPIFLFSLVPVVFFFKSICPLLCEIRRSTNRRIFDKSTTLPSAGKEVDCCY